MKRIGIRELRQHASTWVARAAAGERLEITDRGRPVARLGPIPRERGLRALVDQGRARAAEGDLLELGAPLAPRRGVPLPSDVARSEREDER